MGTLKSPREFFVLLVLAWSIPLAESGPKSEKREPLVYLPTTVGDKRDYEQVNNGVKLESTEEVIAVERKGGSVYVNIQTSVRGTKLRVEKYQASDHGIFLLASGSKVFDPPKCLLRLSAKEGESWEFEVFEGFKWKYTMGKEEEVEVPAGKFKALRVDGESGSVRCSLWLAPGRGYVKQLFKDKDTELVTVLKSFTPGTK